MDKAENTKKSPLCALLSKERDCRVTEKRHLIWVNGCSSTEGSGATTIYTLPHGRRELHMKIIEKNLSEKLKLRRYAKRLVPVLFLPQQKNVVNYNLYSVKINMF